MATTPAGDGFRRTATRVFRWVLLGAAGGAWAGFFVGGVTGRIAMFVLRLTSDDRLRGRETDDGFEIGVISSGTFFLMLFCALFGLLTGGAYVAWRWAVPGRYRVPVAALLGALVGGSLILHGDGIDFRVLEPRSLAVAMFIVVPSVTTAAIAWLIERWDRWWFLNARRTVLIAAPLILPLYLIALGIQTVIAVPLLAFAAKNDRLVTWARRYGPPLVWVTLLVVAGLGGWALVNDVTAIL